jgi:hypothetical protein
LEKTEHLSGQDARCGHKLKLAAPPEQQLGRYAPVADAPPGDAQGFAPRPLQNNLPPKKMGFRKVTNPRTSLLKMQVTPEEEAMIMRKAKMCCVTTSEYMRKCALGKRVEVKFDAYVILELSQISRNLGLLRDAMRERPDFGDFDEEIFRLLATECISAMQRLI